MEKEMQTMGLRRPRPAWEEESGTLDGQERCIKLHGKERELPSEG